MRGRLTVDELIFTMRLPTVRSWPISHGFFVVLAGFRTAQFYVPSAMARRANLLKLNRAGRTLPAIFCMSFEQVTPLSKSPAASSVKRWLHSIHTRREKTLTIENVDIQVQMSGLWRTVHTTQNESQQVLLRMKEIKSRYSGQRVRAVSQTGQLIDLLE